jgi:hypothetical protein
MFVFVASVVRLSVCHRLESVRVALVDGQLLLVVNLLGHRNAHVLYMTRPVVCVCCCGDVR